MRHVVIGTAGHVDHGKTWLTKALTGTDTDRLKEERERGITIDIGFARLELPDGRVAGIVDVPGHEGLIKNMLAGATGIDVALLVVAADEGFMPQTVEHLEILQLLGVRQGILVLTKADLVDDEWLEVVRADCEDRVAGTFLEGAPVVAVSAKTGEGIEELRRLICEAVDGGAEGRASLSARLPVDRVFTVRGHGTVVTGSLIDGRVRTGDTLVAYPQLKSVRVRELQNHGQRVAEAEAGMRVAMNLTGVERSDIERGCTLAAPGTLELTRCVSARLEVLADAPFSVRNASNLHFYAGTQELVGRVRLLGADVLEPGQHGMVQFFFDEPLAARNLDRFVVRFFSPLVTIGGGALLDVRAHRLRRHDEASLARLAALDGPLESRVRALVADGGCALMGTRDLVPLVVCPEAELARTVGGLCDQGVLLRVGSGLAVPEALEGAAAYAERLVGKYHAQHGLEPGMRGPEFRERLSSALPGKPQGRALEALVGWLVSKGSVVVAGDCIALPGFVASYSDDQRRLADGMLEALRGARFEARQPEELAFALGCGARELSAVVAKLAREGLVVPLFSGALLSREAYDEALSTFRSMFNEAQTVALADFRTKIGVSRKYAHLILDHFDHVRISKLVGDSRVLLGGKADA